MDTLIFTLDDVQQIRKVSVNIEDFDIFAREAQITYLEKVLGPKLYNAFISELQMASVPQRSIDLLNGVVYNNTREINYRGVKPYLCYVWLYLYSLESATAVTPTGSRIFKDERAEYSEKFVALKSSQKNYMNGATAYENGVLEFLRNNTSVYPEFQESNEIEVAKKTDYTFKVQGRTYDFPDTIW